MPRLTNGSTIGNFPYRIDRHIGKGNMADAYLATVGEVSEGRSPNYVVLKIARTDGDHKDFYHDVVDNEANLLRQLRHTNIVRLQPVRTGSTPGGATPYVAVAASLPGRPQFIVTEYLSGGSLEDLLKSQKQFDLAMALDIGSKIASALDYIHTHDMVHQDIKPENILFRRPTQAGRETEPVLVDFGIARVIGQEGLEARTIHYAAPERLSKSTPPERMPPPHPSMDVWALGVVLYQMVTGQRPFDERSDKRLTSAILETEPKEPAQLRGNLPPELNKLILRTLSKRPDGRPPAHELAEQLEEIILKEGLGLETPSVAPLNPISLKQGRSGWGRRLVLVGLAAIVVIGLWTSRNWRGIMPPEAKRVLILLDRQVSGLIGLPTPDSGGGSAVAGTQAVSIADATHTPTATTIPPTSTPVPPMKPTPTPTFFTSTPVPATATDTPTPTASPTETLVPPTETAVATNTVGLTAAATPTRSATRTPTVTRTSTAPPTPFVTSTPIKVTAIPVPKNTSTRPPAPPTPSAGTQPPTPVPSSGVPANASVTLRSPSDGAAGGGSYNFLWTPTFTLGPGQAFELVFWKEGQNPMTQSFGLAGTTTSTNTSVNLDALDDQPNPLNPDTYQWGVLLVETNPYRRLAYLGEGWRFTFNRSR